VSASLVPKTHGNGGASSLEFFASSIPQTHLSAHSNEYHLLCVQICAETN
jgi:hypothetical protein